MRDELENVQVTFVQALNEYTWPTFTQFPLDMAHPSTEMYNVKCQQLSSNKQHG